ncbi:MAG: hypothetical protein J3R72DRAFT_453220 [Linnemannia gamsii]|nr:MAG: hypothetical protein J3R72DRAFT_453220 [Linnemannia gamsii]
MTRTHNTKSRLLTSAIAIALLTLQGTEASISCSSPSGSFQVGDRVSLSLSGNNWWPRLKDIYSITANVYCSSGGSKVTSMSISNGDGWTIPEDVLGRCSNNQMYVQYTGSLYDIAHIAHILPYWESCGSMTVSARPQPPVTTTTKPPTPPTTQPPIPTTNNPKPTEVPPITTNPTTQPPVPTTTVPQPPVYTTTFTLVPTVISGTTTVVPVTTVVIVTPSVLPPILPSPGSSTGALVPDNSQLPGLPPSPNGQNNNGGSQKNGSNSNVPVAALGAVGGVAALALIVFGLVVTRRRRRMREEQAIYSSGLGSKDDYYYDGSSSMGGSGAAVVGGAAGASAAYGAAATGHHSSDDMSIPSLHHAYTARNIHPPADSSTTYGWDFDASSSAAAGAGAGAGGEALSAFPVPVSTSDALKQQYDLANRLSVVSHDDSMLGFPAVPSTPPQAPASATAAYALNQQLSLKQEMDDEDEELHHASIVAAGVAAKTPELYYLPVAGASSGNNFSTTTTTPSQAFVSAYGSPGNATFGLDGTTTRSSAYETVHSNSSAYATANSPSWSAASLQSHDIAIPMPPTTSSANAGPSGGAGQQANIQDLIRDVLRDD